MTGGRIKDSMPTTSDNFFGLLTRRDVVRLGSLSLGASLLPAGLIFGDARSPRPRARSVIFLWLAGGVTHIDSLAPKPNAPAEIRGTLGTIQTALPGVRFSEVMPGLARQLPRLALVRSFSHDSDDHFISQAHVLSGRRVTLA